MSFTALFLHCAFDPSVLVQVTGGAQKKLSSISKVRKNVSHCSQLRPLPASPSTPRHACPLLLSSQPLALLQIARVLTIRNEKARSASLAAHSKKYVELLLLAVSHVAPVYLPRSCVAGTCPLFARQEDACSSPEAVAQRRTRLAFPVFCWRCCVC